MFCAEAKGFALTEEQTLHGTNSNENFHNTSESLNASSQGMKVSIKVFEDTHVMYLPQNMYSSRYIWLQMCSTQGAIPVSSAVYRTQ
jgi:hypothetical protein